MKKIITLFIAFALLFVVTSCDNTKDLDLLKAKEALVIEENYQEDFQLPSTIEGFLVEITWTCNSEYLTIENNQAKVNRPSAEEGNKQVTLTATLKTDVSQDTKLFIVNIICEKGLKDLQTAASNIKLDKTLDIDQDFILPGVIDDINIKWESSNSELVEIEKTNDEYKAIIKQVNYVTDTTTVTLTATLYSKNVEYDRSFIISVKVKDASITLPEENYEMVIGQELELDLTTTKYKVQDIIYTYDNDNIVSISKDGLVTAINNGEVNVTMSFLNEAYEKKINIVVDLNELDTLTFDEEEIIIGVNDDVLLVPTIHSAFWDLIVYEVSDESIISVTEDGKVSALKEGVAYVLASITEFEVEKSIKITVSNEAKKLTAHFINVGQADCILIELPNDEVMMIDAGYSSTGTVGKDLALKNIYTYLDNLGIKTIDYFVITHNHQDHYALVPDIIEKYEVLNLFGSGSKRTNVQYLNIMESIKNAGLEYQVLSMGDKIIDEKNLLIQVVATAQSDTDPTPNTTSVMIRIKYKDIAYLFTGDAGYTTSKDGENLALNSGLDISADVLKVGHHGSATSSSNEFLAKVMPKYAVLTTSNNSRDNLPTQSAINRILAIGASIYQTKDNGNIAISTDGKNITVTCEKGN